MKKQIVVIPGNGIGSEITQQSVRILHAIADVWAHEFEFRYCLMGADAMEKTGSYLPEETIESCKKCDAILLGSVLSNNPAKTTVEEEKTNRGLSQLKKALQVLGEIRPVGSFPSLYHLSPLKAKHIQGLELVIISAANEFNYADPREETGDQNQEGNEITNTKKRVEKVVQLGFEFAQQQRSKLTLISEDKPTMGFELWQQTVTERAGQYPGVEVSEMLIENVISQIIFNPQQFDVILTDNPLFGNILSNEAGMISGSPGLLAGGSVGNDIAMFGAARKDDLQELREDLANPIGCILSAAMLLEYLEMKKEANLVREAVDWTLKNNFVTKDLDSVNFYLTSTIGELIVEYISNKTPEELQQNDNDLRKSTII